jgi:hypothetical protein
MDLLSPTIFLEVTTKEVRSTPIRVEVIPTGEQDFPLGVKRMFFRETKMPEGNKMIRWQLLALPWT